MKMSIFFSTLVLLLTSCSSKGLAKTENEAMQEYLENTLDNINYDKRVPPTNFSSPGSPINVTVTMYILDISKVDDMKKEFDTQFYFRQSWVDPRLRFSGDKLEAVILREVDKIWTPDLFFINEKKGELNKIVHPNIFCRIKPDGQVLYSVRLTERLSCSMNLRKFPFDTQECEIRAESYGFTTKHINLNWGEGKPVGVASNITEDEFEVLDVTPKLYRVNFSAGEYTTMKANLKFQRKFGYFARRLYVPFTLLVLFSWLPLWLKAKEKYFKLTILLVVLYLMVTIASELELSVPKTPYTKASDVWIGFCEVMVFAAFLEFIASSIIATEAEETRSKCKGEIMCSLDPEGKETNVNVEVTKTGLNKFIAMFEARNGGKGMSDVPNHIDKISRILFPIIFSLFNIIYWAVCCS